MEIQEYIENVKQARESELVAEMTALLHAQERVVVSRLSGEEKAQRIERLKLKWNAVCDEMIARSEKNKAERAERERKRLRR
jgi:uncharacterized protein YaiL (DUF2058 family)